MFPHEKFFVKLPGFQISVSLAMLTRPTNTDYPAEIRFQLSWAEQPYQHNVLIEHVRFATS